MTLSMNKIESAAATAANVLSARGLSKRFGAVAAVDNVDLEVCRGEIFGFLGPNGAGKTTTLGMVLGLVQPSAGSVELLGQPVVAGSATVLRRVGALLGAPALYPHLSAVRHLELLRGLQPSIPQSRVAEVLELVGLTQAARRAAGTYSTGMKQRLGLAMALLAEPEFLILDEPTSGMDPAGMKEVRELMKRLAAGGMTVLFSSHNLSEVEQVCDRVAVMHKGRVVAQGAVGELLGQGAGVRVRVEAPEAALRLLERAGGSVRADGDYLEVAGLDAREIVRRLVAADLVPSEVQPLRAGLERKFLEITAA